MTALIDDVARALGLPPLADLRSLRLVLDRDGDSFLELGVGARLSAGAIDRVAYAIRDRAELEARVVRCPWGSVDTETGQAYWSDGSPVLVSKRERALLMALARRPGLVVPQRELLVAVWGPEWLDDEHNLRVAMSHLRRRLGDVDHVFIRTFRGGYALTVAEPEGAADARVSACAPELLAILRAILTERWDLDSLPQGLYERARLAVALATGEPEIPGLRSAMRAADGASGSLVAG